MKTHIVAIIPARWQSSRFPGKPLARIAGKPMLQRVFEQCRKARRLDATLVATDDRRIFDAAREFGAPVVMTRSTHPSGTDRIAEAARRISADIILNVQADEPLISPRAIDKLAGALSEGDAPMATLATPIRDGRAWRDPNVVKVVVNRYGFALYFSRSMIPYPRDTRARPKLLKHLGIYAYRREFLLRWPRLGVTPLERVERLEQLRALEHGVPLLVLETSWDSVAVDTPGDLRRVEARLRQ